MPQQSLAHICMIFEDYFFFIKITKSSTLVGPVAGPAAAGRHAGGRPRTRGGAPGTRAGLGRAHTAIIIAQSWPKRPVKGGPLPVLYAFSPPHKPLHKVTHTA